MDGPWQQDTWQEVSRMDAMGEDGMIVPENWPHQPPHQRIRDGLESARCYMHHISEVSECVSRAVVYGGRHAIQYSSYAVEVAMASSSGDSTASRVWKERIAPPLHAAGSAVARPLAPLSATLSVGGSALLAAADTATVARGLMYTSVRQASADLASAVLGDGAGAVVAEGLDTIVAAQQTVSAITCQGLGWLVHPPNSAALANNLLYHGIKRGSSEAVARRFGQQAAVMTAESLESLTAGSARLSSVGWALSACSSVQQRRILATAISHADPAAAASAATDDDDCAPSTSERSGQPRQQVAAGSTSAVYGGNDHNRSGGSSGDEGGGGSGNEGGGGGSGEGGGDGEDDTPESANETWILLGAPWLEGHVALRPLCHPNADVNASAPMPWRRVWCVLQDSAFAFFEHERAAADDQATPLDAIEWLHIRSITLDDETPRPPHTAIAPASASSAVAAAPAAASASTAATASTPFTFASSPLPATASASASSSGSTFQMRLSDGRSLSVRVDTPTQRALWVREILRLASWRAIHVLQLELASEWQHVRVMPHSTISHERQPNEWEPPTCSSPPSQPKPN
uniref:PH domain-containing protein n=1 Tax=Haptolina brevifila TaxID=156173 RepID=A0A7S2CGS0_9EUKA